MNITKKEYELMIHAVGHLKSKSGGRVKSKLSSCFRNYFAEDPEGCPIWDGLIEKGFAKVIRLPDRIFDYKTYAVTEDGFVEILKYRNQIKNAC